jgi:pyruvate kinase
MRKAKIVCTMGPATENLETLRAMIRAGMDVARVNFSHGGHDGHRKMTELVREAARLEVKPVAVLGDLQGPKIRLGCVAGGTAELQQGAEVSLVFGEFQGTVNRLAHCYQSMHTDVKPGSPILINDGLIRLRVERCVGNAVICRVEEGGLVSDRKGINLPGTEVSAPALTDKDQEDVRFAVELGLDYLALSFVRNAAEINETRILAGGIPVLAKIEKPEAVADLDAILEAADGVMVARGDLGVEVGHEKVPMLQKRIIKAVRPLAKPVITATQMLESMITSATPTRAEVSDVANAVLDGTDAVMLSGETSVGRHPVLVVETMARIIDEVESVSPTLGALSDQLIHDHSFSAMIAEAVSAAAREYNLSAMAVYTESGRSAALLSAERPAPPIIAFTRHDSVLHRLALLWGVRPLHGDWVRGVEGVVAQAERELLARNLVRPGDAIAVTFGMRLGNEPFQTNMLKLWKVRDAADGSLERVIEPPK